MVAAAKPASNADRLVALYRIEEKHWSAGEIIEGLIALPNMKPATKAKVWATLNRTRCCADSTVQKMATSAIREMVASGHAAEVEAFIRQQAESRRPVERAYKIAKILETARCVDATFPRAALDRAEGNWSSTELMLRNAIAAADEHALAAMLEAVLSVASDRVVNAVYTERESEEQMLAEYHADQKRSAA